MSEKKKTRAELIEELTRMRQQIIASEEKYRTLVDNTKIPITYLTPDCYILLVNKIGASNLGGKPEDFIGKSLREVLPQIFEITESRIARIAKTGAGEQFEDLITLPQGHKWFRSTFHPVQDAKGEVFAIQLVSDDNTERKSIEQELERYRDRLEDMVWTRTEELRQQIDERKRAEEALRESEERYSSMLENSPDYILEVDRDLKILFLNRPATGHTIDEVIGTNLLDYVEKDHHKSFANAIRHSFDTGSVTSLETPVNFRDGRHILETRFGPITRGGEIITAVMGATDITGRKQMEEALRESEERFRSVVDTATDAIITINSKGNIVYCNHGAEIIFGYQSKDLWGKSAEILIPEKARNFHSSGLMQMVSSRLPSSHNSMISGTALTKDGIEVPIELTSSKWKVGEQEFFTAIIRDITERKRAEEALKKSSDFLSKTESIAGIGGWEMDLQTREVTWTDGMRLLHGYPLEYQPSLKDTFAMCHPDDLKSIKEASAQVLEHGGSYDLEVRVFTMDNREIWVRMLGGVEFVKGKSAIIHGTSQNITEWIEAERAIKLSEERFRSIFENVTDTIVYADMNGTIIDANRKIEDISGYSPKELIGKSFTDLDFLSSDSVQEISRTLTETVINGAAPQSIQIDINHKNEARIIAETSPSLMSMSDGTEGILVVIRDVTQRRKSEEALKESERKYRLLADNVIDVIWTMNMNFQLTYISPSIKSLQGYSVEEMIALPLEENLTPDSYETALDIFAEELVTEELGTGKPSRSRTLEMEVFHKDGSTVQIEMKVSFLRDQQGQPIGIIGITRDIGKRKEAEKALVESEEKYRKAVTLASDVLWEMDLDGNIKFISDRVSTLLGYTAKEVISMNSKEFLTEETYKYSVTVLAERLRTDAQRRGTEYSPIVMEVDYIRKDGTIVQCETSNIFVRDDEGNPVGIAGVIRDITVRKQAETQLLQHNRELAALNTIAQTATRSLDIKDILKSTLTSILELLDIGRCFVSLLDDNDCLILKAQQGIPSGYLTKINKRNLSNEQLEQTIRAGKPRFVDSIFDLMSTLNEKMAQAIIEDGFGSVMYVPLKTKAKNLGLITAITDTGRTFTVDEQNLLITIGHQTSTVIENAMLYEELQREGEIRREGLRQAILAQEEERRRIARGLHDQTSQVLTGASAMIEASVAGLPWGFDKTKENLKQVRASLTNMLVDVRNIIYELRPTMLDDLGLVAAARWQAEEFLERSGVKARFETKGRSRKLPPQVETALFRIIQEATTNVVKHAQAESARIKIEFGREIIKLEIEDDGKGFDLQKTWQIRNGMRGLGFVSMRERTEILGGTFVIDSKPDNGTRITIEVPL